MQGWKGKSQWPVTFQSPGLLVLFSSPPSLDALGLSHRTQRDVYFCNANSRCALFFLQFFDLGYLGSQFFFGAGQHFTPILCIHSLVLWRFLKLGFQVSAKLHSTKDSALDYSHGFSKFDTRQLFCLAVSPLLWRQMVFLSERGLNELQLISFNYSVIGINHIFHEYKSCFLKFFKKKVCWFSPMLCLF